MDRTDTRTGYDIFGTDSGPSHTLECPSTIYAYHVKYSGDGPGASVQAKCCGCAQIAAEFQVSESFPTAKDLRIAHTRIASK